MFVCLFSSLLQVRNRINRMWGAVIIQKYVRGWLVSRNDLGGACYVPVPIFLIMNYRLQVRKKMHGMKVEEAGPIITKFIKQALVRKILLRLFHHMTITLLVLTIQRYRFLITLHYNLPSRSPLDKKWPRCSKMFRRTSVLLRNMYHAWRVCAN